MFRQLRPRTITWLVPWFGAAAMAGALEADFTDVRFEVGECEGYTSDKVIGSQLNGAPDPVNNGKLSLSPYQGIDFEPGAHVGEEIDGGFGLTFGMDMVLRTPGADYYSTTDTGVASGSGSGDVQEVNHMRIRSIMFGAKFDFGVYQVIGPIRIELTPFLGAGSVRARFQQFRVYDNDPTNLLSGNDANASWSQNAAYWEYGATVGIFANMPGNWLLLGVNGGYLASHTSMSVIQHGPVFDQAQNRLSQAGWFAMGALVFSF
jgi:hypothetical protein